MIISDFTKLNRRQLMEHFEKERREWLAARMSEADIFRIHFGEQNEDGRGGDYRVWLNERKYHRSDHKYAPGMSLSMDQIDPDGVWISGRDWLDEVELNHDLEAALSRLTNLQRTSFVEVRLDGRTQADVANELGIKRESVKQAIEGAVKKLKKYF